jgi:UDP-N-acetylmuramyl pentapeptide phosphotransferase/UDP-N-acetylglucosamine-1-phosphate transferase
MSLVLAFAAAALVLSWAGTAAVRTWALRRGVLDVPNERSSHVAPTPRGGGAAIVAVVLGGAALGGAVGIFRPAWPLLAAGAGGLLVALVSLKDDLRPLPALIRLAAHVAAAGVLVGGMPAAWGLPAAFWLVGLTNAYNFMDGIDGIAGLQGAVAGSAWAAIGWLAGRPEIALLGALLAAASLGFLAHNWSPARIFMGDVGSAFLGYSFAALPLLFDATSLRSLLMGVLVVWPFVLDSGFTLLRRLLRGENVLTAHRGHLYQRWAQSGAPHARIALAYGALSLLGAGLAVWILAA